MSNSEGSAVPTVKVEDSEVNLLDLFIVLAKHKKLVIGLPFCVAIAAVVISLLLPVIYTGTTKIVPPQQGNSLSSTLFNQLGALGGLGAGALGVKTASDVYVGMLKSRTIADQLIARFDLNTVYEQKWQSYTRKTLQSRTDILATKDGIITVSVDDEDPKRAAAITNAYVDELLELTKVLAVTEASQRRLFFEQQLEQTKEKLKAAEIAAREGLEKGGLAKVDDQGRAMVEMTARLRGQISVKEVQIGAMRTYAADDNPQLQAAQRELDVLRRQLGRFEGSGQNPMTSGNSAGGRSGLDNLAKLRDVKYFETMYELLARQFELAKIDESKDSSIVQVMDRAIEPDRKSKPRRAIIVLLATLAAFFASILLACAMEAVRKASQDSQKASQLQALKRYLAWS